MRSFQITDVKHEFLTSEYVTSRIITTLVSIIICMIAAIDVNDPYQSLCINLYMIIKATEAVIDVFHGIDQIHERFDYIFVSCVLRGIAFVACFTVGLKLTGKLAVAILLIALVHIIIGVFYDIRKTTKLEEVKLNTEDLDKEKEIKKVEEEQKVEKIKEEKPDEEKKTPKKKLKGKKR